MTFSRSHAVPSPMTVGGLMSGPNPYTAGGFAFDPGAFASVKFFDLEVQARGTLPVAYFDIAYDTPAAGKVTITVRRHRFDKLTAIGSAQNAPAGVSVQTQSGHVVTVEAVPHVHTMNHDHASVGTSVENAAGGAVLAAVSGNYDDHTHQVDPPNFTGNTGGGGHQHAWNVLYQHQHTLAAAVQTTVASSEVADGANLSASSWRWIAAGV